MRIPAIIVLTLAVALAPAGASGQWNRPALLAGTWYPQEQETLAGSLDRFLSRAKHPRVSGRVKALVVPHAGYAFSGRLAAAAWRLAGEITPRVATVVLVGPAHRHPLQRPSIWPRGAYETPLGPVPVDAELAADLTRGLKAEFVRQAHMCEHCLEVQAPFIRKVLPGAKLVTILTGPPDARGAREMGRVLARAVKGKPVLLVASTDLSHFHSQQAAEVLDSRAARRVCSLDPEGLLHDVSTGKSEACGLMALMAVLHAARELGANRGQVLERCTSASATGNLKNVVGYMSAALIAPGGESRVPEPDGALTPSQKQVLRDLAWQSVQAAAHGRDLPAPPRNQAWLEREGRVFVTLRTHGRLRGCIGNPMGGRPLGQAVVEMAAAAAGRDPRFKPVSPAELDTLQLEISLLTPPRATTADAVRVGSDGLVIRHGGRGGLLLPQVPTEQGWDRREYLEGLCRKAGLPAGAWQEPDCRLYRFQALVF